MSAGAEVSRQLYRRANHHNPHGKAKHCEDGESQSVFEKVEHLCSPVCLWLEPKEVISLRQRIK